MEILFNIISAILGITVLVCVGLYFYNFYHNESDLFYQSHEWKIVTFPNKLIVIGAYIGFSIAFYQGSIFCLSWLPQNWGTIDESGDFVSLASTVSIILTLCGIVSISKIEGLYRYKQISILIKEEDDYIGRINNPYTDLIKLKKEITEKEEIHNNYVKAKGPLTAGGYYRYFSQKKALTYKKLLKRIKEKSEINA